MQCAIPAILALLNATDDDVVADACWAVSYLTDGESDRIQAVVNAGMIPRLIELLAHHNVNVQTPTLRAIGNIVTGDDAQTQAVIDHGALLGLARLLTTAKESFRKEVCW